MPLGYATVQVSGIDLEDANGTPCQCLVLDGANLLATVTASATVAADGTPHIQTLSPAKGKAFGIKANFIPPDVLNAVVAAVNAAVAAGDSFNITAEDDIHSISEEVYPDFSQQWLSYPPQRTNETTIKEAVFRFITAE